MWEVVVVACFKAKSQNLRRGTDKNHKTLTDDSQCPSPSLNLASPKYKPKALPLESTCSQGIFGFKGGEWAEYRECGPPYYILFIFSHNSRAKTG
jgi:hypothetical protein